VGVWMLGVLLLLLLFLGLMLLMLIDWRKQ
jgi:hypothetical protein